MPGYDLRSLSLPRLTGATLRTFAAAATSPRTRPLLLPTLLQQGGFDRLHAARIDEPPTFTPLVRSPSPARQPLTPAEAGDVLGPAREGLVFTTVGDYTRAYRSRRTDPVEVAERVLAAMTRADGGPDRLALFIASDRDDLLEQARASAERHRAGRPLSVLDGVPVAIKDEVDQVPYPTTVGTAFLGTAPAASDATAVARLRAAGALLVGKANMHEIGINPNGFNYHYGQVRNPYGTGHDTGGSSSGPAGAVAAGLVPLALGADGGGSIRIPASLCGVVGLEPTYGRVSEQGAFPLGWSVAHLGPMGATVEDVALGYALMAGPDRADGNTAAQPAVTVEGWRTGHLRGVRLGIYRPWFEHAAPAVVAACEGLLGRLAEAGAVVCDITVPDLDLMRLAHIVSILSEMASSMRNYPGQIARSGPSVRTTLAITHGINAADYVIAQRIRTRAMAAFDAIFREVDVLVTPSTAITAPRIPAGGVPGGYSDLSTDTELMRYAFPGNLAGLPAISFPAGYDAAGLPVGMQAMGRHWEEALLLRVAAVAEQHVERRRPGVFFPVLD